MYIITLEYNTDFTEIDPFMDEHFQYLKKHYDDGLFVVSGRKEPRTGGVIIVRNADRSLVERVMKEDPFYREGVADYLLTEFIPGTVALGFEELKEDAVVN